MFTLSLRKYGEIDVEIPRDLQVWIPFGHEKEYFISLWSLQQAKEPKLVPKEERFLKDSEELILSLYATAHILMIYMVINYQSKQFKYN